MNEILIDVLKDSGGLSKKSWGRKGSRRKGEQQWRRGTDDAGS